MTLMKILAAVVLLSASLFAQPQTTEQNLTTSGGDAVSMDKEWLAVGDPAAAQVQLFQLNYSKFGNGLNNAWELKTALTNVVGTEFGASVAVNDGYLLVGAPKEGKWRMEVGSTTVESPQDNPKPFKDINFAQPFETTPAVFILTGEVGNQPAALRVKDVNLMGFKVAILEPENSKNPRHSPMTNIHYLAIEKGRHVLPNGKVLLVGETTTKAYKGKGVASTSPNIVSLGTSFSTTPVVLAQVQTLNNEVFNNTTHFSDPWLTAMVKVTSNTQAEIALETSKTGTENNINNEETIAWLAIEEQNETLNGHFFTVTSDSNVTGWGGGVSDDANCTTVTFNSTTNNALVLANKNSRIEDDGGWIRRCAVPTAKTIGLAIDENVDPNVAGDNRDHVAEKVGLIAFDGPFTTEVTPPGGIGKAYLYQYNTSNSTWELRSSVDQGNKDEALFGTSVALQSDGSSVQMAVGAPTGLNSVKTAGGNVQTYVWNSTASALETVNSLNGSLYHEHKFGQSLDMKGERLIVGAPDEESSVSQNDFVGAAYTFENNGTAWVKYPSTNLIKRNITNEKLGTHVAIENSNAIVSTAPSASDGSWRYEVDATSSTWVEKTHFYQGIAAHGVDMEDNISMSTSGTDQVKLYINDLNHTKYGYSDMTVTTSTITGALDSVQLYKDQIVVSDPGNTQAVAIDVPCGIRPTELKANEWAMISVPCDVGSATIRQLFNAQLGGTYGENGTWVMYEDGPNYTGKAADYVMSDVNQPMELGKGYWIITNADRLLEVQNITTRTQITSISNTSDIVGYYEFPLPPVSTTNDVKIMVGNPFPRAFKWADVRVDTNGSLGYVVDPVAYVYDVTDPDGTGQPYRAVTTTTPGLNGEIPPYTGFWIKKSDQSASGHTLSFPFVK